MGVHICISSNAWLCYIMLLVKLVDFRSSHCVFTAWVMHAAAMWEVLYCKNEWFLCALKQFSRANLPTLDEKLFVSSLSRSNTRWYLSKKQRVDTCSKLKEGEQIMSISMAMKLCLGTQTLKFTCRRRFMLRKAGLMNSFYFAAIIKLVSASRTRHGPRLFSSDRFLR